MIQFYRPTLKRRDMDSVLQTMVNEKIGPGERTAAFVRAFCETVGATSGDAYRTYPDCIRAALSIAGVTEGTRVAVSPLSPSVYRSVIASLGAEMVMVDVIRENGCVNEDLLRESGCDVLLLYENAGTLPARYNDVTTFPEYCDFSPARVIEDISQSIGSQVGEEISAGRLGGIVICALEEDSVVSAGGGAVLAVRGEFASALRENRPGPYLTMPDMNAALGTVQLGNLYENGEKCRDIHRMYAHGILGTANRQFGLSLADFRSNGAFFAVLLDSRPDETVKFAAKHDVPVRMAFSDCLLKDFDGDPFENYPVAASYYYRTVEFPLYPFLKRNEIETVAKVVAHLP